MIIAGILLSVFASFAIADQRCSVTPDLEPCSANGNGLKYYFNATRGACNMASQWPTKMCVASGQGGFGDHMSCVHACECTQPPNENRCADGQTPNRLQVERWFFNPDSGVCEAFTNYGCSGVCIIFGKNEFVHESVCKQKCICTKPVDTGRGDQDIISFAFNVQDKRCEEFSYKGEGGNANRFANSEDCMDKCLCGLEAQNGDGICRVWHNFQHTFTTKMKTGAKGSYMGVVVTIPIALTPKKNVLRLAKYIKSNKYNIIIIIN